MSRWVGFNLAIMLSLMSGGGGSAEDTIPGKADRPSRFRLSTPLTSPQSISPRSAQKSNTTDGQAEHTAPEPEPPSRVPSLDEMILFQPSRKGEWKPTELKYTDVEFESGDGTTLHSWYCPADAPRAVVLYCHGNGGNIAMYAGFLEFLRTKHQLSILAFDYRGYGQSRGTPTVEGVLEDGRAARAKLAELAGVPSTEVVIWGRSMGGAVAVQLASEERPRALILECTFDSFKSVAKHHAPRWAFLVPDDRLASVQRIPLVTCPLYQVHGTADRVVPFESGQTLFEAANEPKFFVTLRDADHNDSSPRKLYDQIDRFLDQKCPKAVAR